MCGRSIIVPIICVKDFESEDKVDVVVGCVVGEGEVAVVGVGW